MSDTIKARTGIHDGVTTVRIIIRHPMYTGYETDETTGKKIPAHYIENVSVFHRDTLVLQCDWSRAISANPYLSFEFSGANPGDPIKISWQDNLGESDSAEFEIAA